MGILVGLVLFTSSVALLMYLKRSKANENIQKNVEVYVASKHLTIGDYIGADSITKERVPQNYISFTPLVAEEIIGRYAKVDIFPKEPIRSEKISISNPLDVKVKKTVQNTDEQKQKIVQTTSDTISIPLSVFKNKDTSLKAGNYIDIVSIIPKQLHNKEFSFSTKYIAIHIPIHSFVSKNVTTSTYTRTVTTTTNKVTKSQIIEADTIVLAMSPKNIKNFLAVYYKAQALNNNRVYNTANYDGQLWLVNAATDVDATIQKQKEKLLVDKKRKIIKRKKRAKKVSISYEK